MSIGIYYFSGTGNSLAVARDVAEQTGGSLIPIASLTEDSRIITPYEVLGIIFPVYYGDLPVIVKEFAGRLDNLQGKYVFAVCTYGGAAMASLRVLRSIIRSRSGELSAAFGVHMPQNSFYKPKEDRLKLYLEWKNKLQFIVSKIGKKSKGIFYDNFLLEMLMVPLQSLIIRPMCKKAFAEKTNMPSDSRMEELIRMLDTDFYTNEKCSGCGTCAKVCPVNNIKIRDSKPVWLHRCENCLACYNWCPNRAIQGGITSKDYYYCHGEVDILEIMQQKRHALG